MAVRKLDNGKLLYVKSYKDHMTGKYKKVSMTIDKNTSAVRAEADALLSKKIEELNSYDIREDCTLSDIVEKYRKYQKDTVKASTYKRNYYACNAILDTLGAETIVNNLTVTYVRDKLLETGKENSTLNEFLARIRALIRWAYMEGLIKRPEWLDRIRLFPDKKHRLKIADKFLEKEQLAEVLDHMDVTMNKNYIQFLALSGLRCGEAIALNVSDIDLKQRLIHVNKTYDPNNKIITSTKTDTSERDVYIQDELLSFINSCLAYNKLYQVKMGIRSKLLFFNGNGGYYNYYTANKYFRNITNKVIGRTLTLHSLRHTHTSLMFEAGVPLEVISERLGHADSQITKDIYLHLTQSKKTMYYEKIKDISLLQ